VENTHTEYPFQIEAIFFENISVSRSAQVKVEPQEYQLHTEIGLGLRGEKNKIQVHFRVRTPDDINGDVNVNIVCIGLAEYQGDGDLSDDLFVKYINDHLLIAMSSKIVQVLATTTTQMGMDPIWLPHPKGFQLPVEVLRELRNQLVHSSN
jgi:hypothetical protein